MRLLIYRMAAIGFGLGLGLALTESALRLSRLAPRHGVATVTEAQYRTVPGIFAPNQRLVDRRNRWLPHTVTIDIPGYRGRNLPRRAAAGEFRILFSGDSFVFGDFVDDEQTLPAQSECLLRRQCDNAPVINAGLGGLTIVEQTELVDRSLPARPTRSTTNLHPANEAGEEPVPTSSRSDGPMAM